MTRFVNSPIRQVIPLNDGWRYRPEPLADCPLPGLDDGAWEPVRLPHVNRELPFGDFDETLSQFESSYRKRFSLPALAADQRAILHFEGVMCAARVWLNGQALGEHRGGYTPFSFDLTPFLAPEGDNLLAVAVDSRERSDIPPFGHVVDYLTYGGIYREVWLEIRSVRHIGSLRVASRVLGPDGRVRPEGPVLELGIAICGMPGGEGVDAGDPTSAAGVGKGLVRGSLWPLDGGPCLLTWDMPLAARDIGGEASGECTIAWQGTVPGAGLWDTENPRLYRLELDLVGPDGIMYDRVAERIGFREIAFRADGFFLNGQPLKLRGLNRHQAWPYVGPAMPARAQRADAEILRHRLGCNIVRQSHYPQSVHFLDRCDEIGLLVFAELPGWQHVGDGDWQDLACRHLESLIRRDRNHASVVIWGVRVNESGDNEAFYRRTNQLARSLDPSRPTGGVRNFGGSQFLEDVYTYNDFVHSGKNRALEPADRIAGRGVPYLVTEHNGHMFPTKKQDPEPRRIEHALRHARVLDAMYASARISGAIGWCQFDYNTHGDFGSGDRICHHGVQDMFRIDKLAAAVYASQSDARPFGRVGANMCPGDHDGTNIRQLYVFTNSEEVRVWRGDRQVGIFKPDRRAFLHLPHPPVLVDDLIGSALETDDGLSRRDALRVKRFLLGLNRLGRLPLTRLPGLFWVCLRKGWRYTEVHDLFGRHIHAWGSKAREYRFEGWTAGVRQWVERKGPAHAQSLEVTVDAPRLHEAGTWDCCRVEVRLRDSLGNDVAFSQESVRLDVEGPLAVIGPASRALTGGSTAFWLRTVGATGTARISASAAGFRSTFLEVLVE